MKITSVFLHEGDKKGGIEHPTEDINNALRKYTAVKEVKIVDPTKRNPVYWYRLGQEASLNCDIVHLHFNYGTFGNFRHVGGVMYPFFALGLGKPLVITLHDFRQFNIQVPSLRFHEVAQFGRQVLLHTTNRFLLESADYFISLTEEEREDLLSTTVDTPPLEFIPIASSIEPEFRLPKVCKAQLGLDGKRIITAFGWIRESKGYDRIIEILSDLPPDVVFLVAGGTSSKEQDEYCQRLKDLAKECDVRDRVNFTGYVNRSEHPTIFNATDIAVFLYQDNRASDALSRALSYHVPSIASDNKEFSSFEQRWGCVKTVSDNNELLDAIRKILEKDGLGNDLKAGAKRFTNEMSWDNVAQRMVSIYKEVDED